jgi:hypothetical protein
LIVSGKLQEFRVGEVSFKLLQGESKQVKLEKVISDFVNVEEVVAKGPMLELGILKQKLMQRKRSPGSSR